MRTSSVVGTVVVLAILWGLVLLIAYGGLHTVTGQALDEVALAQAKADRKTYFPNAVLVVSQYLPEVVAVVAGIVALVWAVRYRRLVPALCAGAAVLAANVTTQFLKHGVLEKPDLGVQQITSNSFPSGHTTAAASLLMALLLVAPSHRRAKAGRWGAFLAALVGMITVFNGWHRPTDAAAALLVVGGWGLVAALVERLIGFARAGSTGSARNGAPGGLHRFREERSRGRLHDSWSEDRGGSAFVPPAHERQAQERERAASASERANRQAVAWQHRDAGHQVEDGSPWFPARPRLATAVTLIVLTTVLLVAAVWWPYPTVAGTLAGRVTVWAGYLGIAAAAALGWAAVAARLRSPLR